MDILSQYEQERSKVQVQQPAYGGTAASSNGFLIPMVMKLSGGRIRDQKQALMVLLVIAGVGLLIAVALIIRNTGATQHPVVNAPPPETVGQQNQLGQ